VDRQIKRLALALAVLFALLFAQLNWIQVFAASRISNNPANFRLIIEEYKVHRGEILGNDLQTVLARSVPTPGQQLKFLRRYPFGSLYGQITGYYSLVYGRSGLEAAENDWLGAHASQLTFSTLADEISNRPKQGASVVTTIDPHLQQVASQAMNGRAGAIAALDPRTGAVLALVANPSYDPNPLSSHNPNEIKAAWKQLNADPNKPLLSNATDQIYPPGSTFKLIDTAAALQNGYTPQSRFPNPQALKLPQTTHLFHNFADSHCPGGSTISLSLAFTVSCDVTFAQLGLKLGAETLQKQAEAFGFNSHIPFELRFSEGRFPPAEFFSDRLPLLAFSAIGQADVAANPLQMALVASAIANHGVEMQPQIVKEIRDPGGGVIESMKPKEFSRPMPASVAATMTGMMVSVVQSGTGTPAQIPGVSVAAKTGTAETPSGLPHVWFVAFAPADHPQIAVAVMLLNGGGAGPNATGGTVAGPVAKQVIEAALGSHG
jgi:penicillin-binding protein A